MEQVQNLSIIERVLRHGLGWGLILAVLQTPFVPPWIAIVAIYPLLTAILAWDPFYQAAQALIPKRPPRVVLKHRPAM